MHALSLSLSTLFLSPLCSLYSFIAGVLKWCLRANRCSSLFLSQLRRLLPPHQWVFPLQSSCHQNCPHHLRNQMKSSPIKPSFLCFHFSGAQKLLQLQFSQSESWIKDRFASFWILYLVSERLLAPSRLCSIRMVYDAKVVAMLWDTLATLEDNTHYGIISTLISPLASTANAKSLERILHQWSESQPRFSDANCLSHQLSLFILRSI